MRILDSQRRRVYRPRLFFFVLISIIPLSFLPLLAQTPFVHETIDVDNPTKGPSLAFDASWDAHIAYLVSLEGSTGEVRYARQTAGVWSIEVVDTVTQLSFTAPALAVDADGTPHIVYADIPNFVPPFDTEIIHVEKTGGVWVPTPIDNVGLSAGYPQVALDPTGSAHVSYFNGDLFYAAESAGFTPEFVDSGVALESHSIAIDDPMGEIAHLSYYKDGDLYHVQRFGGGFWFPRLVDTPTLSFAFSFNTSIALDAQGSVHISYADATVFQLTNVKHATNKTGDWETVVVDSTIRLAGFGNSIAIDSDGEPRISYSDGSILDLSYATRTAGVWTVERVGLAPGPTSLALGIHGNPHIAANVGGGLTMSDAAVHLVAPAPGTTWDVGSEGAIMWRGQGAVNLYLSVDGGNTYDQIATGLYGGSNVSGGAYTLTVPHTPSKFCKVKVERLVPFSESVSDSFFTIETSISLLQFTVTLGGPEAGAVMEWDTDPGPEDLAGYKIEKWASRASSWETIVELIRETSYHDRLGGAGDRYRLSAVNGLGMAYIMGEASAAPSLANTKLSAWPLPYNGNGDLSIAFGTFGPLGSQSAEVEIDIYDIRGRRVRSVARGVYPAGVNVVTWDGRSASGRAVATGVYFIVAKSAGFRSTKRVVVVR